MNNDLFFKDCFTEVEEGKVNVDLNKATLKCFDSKDNKFSMDCEGNLVVNSIITREQNANTGVTVDQIYPAGSIYMSASATNPSNLFGGVWEQIKGRFLLGCGENEGNSVNTYGDYNAGTCNFASGEKGGEPWHQLSAEEMPVHNHIGVTDVGGNHAHQVALNGDNTFNVFYRLNWGTTNSGYCISGNNLNGTSSGNSFPSIATPNGDHQHSFTTSAAGASYSHNNMPPYLTVYIWKRVA